MNNTRLEAARILEILNGSKITPEEKEIFFKYGEAGNELSEYEIELLKKLASDHVAAGNNECIVIDMVINNEVKENTMNNVVNDTIINQVNAEVNAEIKVEINKVKVDVGKLLAYYNAHKADIMLMDKDERDAIAGKLMGKKVDLDRVPENSRVLDIFLACAETTVDEDPMAALEAAAKLAEANIQKELDKAAKKAAEATAVPKTWEEKTAEATAKAKAITESTVRVGVDVGVGIVSGAMKGLFGKRNKIKIR